MRKLFDSVAVENECSNHIEFVDTAMKVGNSLTFHIFQSMESMCEVWYCVRCHTHKHTLEQIALGMDTVWNWLLLLSHNSNGTDVKWNSILDSPQSAVHSLRNNYRFEKISVPTENLFILNENKCENHNLLTVFRSHSERTVMNAVCLYSRSLARSSTLHR